MKKLNEVEVKEEYQVKVSNRFSALRNLDDMMKLMMRNYYREFRTSATETTGCYEMKEHKL
jgi:hypothetical protein